jgi:hypothetical protein
MPLGRAPGAFSHPDWIFELKWDGFRAIAYIDAVDVSWCREKGNEFRSYCITESIAAYPVAL